MLKFRISRSLKVFAAGIIFLANTAPTNSWADQLTLPALKSAPVPYNLKPSLLYAKSDRAKPYGDHCHVQQNLTTTSATCVYGDSSSFQTIVLFGDSHALSWFPAIEKLAKAKQWKLISLTMSSCWPADIPPYNPTKKILMSNCQIWRDKTLQEISDIQPDITFVAGTRGFSTLNEFGEEAYGDERSQLWREGMQTTLQKIVSASSRTIYLGDYPISTQDPVVCLQKNLKDYSKCATPEIKAIDFGWINSELNVAKESGAEFIDPSTWICKTDPCSPIDGRKLIYLDAGHLTATFAVTLEAPLWNAITSATNN